MLDNPAAPPEQNRDPAIVDEAARESGVTDPKLIEHAKDQLKELKAGIANTPTKSDLTPEQEIIVNGIKLKAEFHYAKARFKEKLEQSPLTKNEAVHTHAIKLFEEFSKPGTAQWPAQFYREWVDTLSAAIIKEMQSFEVSETGGWGPRGELTKDKLDVFFTGLKDAQHGGIGDFETWFKKNHEKEYTSANTERTAAITKGLTDEKTAATNLEKMPEVKKRVDQLEAAIAANTKPDDATRDEVKNMAETVKAMNKEFTFSGSLTQKYSALPEAVRKQLPPEMQKEVEELNKKVETSDGKNLKELQEADTKWDVRLTACETLTSEATAAKISDAILHPILVTVLKEEKTYVQAHAELEAAKSVPPAKASEKQAKAPNEPIKGTEPMPDAKDAANPWSSTEETGIGAFIAFCNDVPTGDGWLEKTERGFKSMLKPIAAMLTAAFAAVAGSKLGGYIEKYAGVSVRDTWIPNDYLLKLGDPRAKACDAGKKRLNSELGLSSDTMEKLKGKTAKKFVTDYEKNPKEYTDKPDQKDRLDLLVAQLKSRVGQKEMLDIPVTELAGMKNASGSLLLGDLKLSEPAAPVAPIAPAVSPAPTTTPAPAPVVVPPAPPTQPAPVAVAAPAPTQPATPPAAPAAATAIATGAAVGAATAPKEAAKSTEAADLPKQYEAALTGAITPFVGKEIDVQSGKKWDVTLPFINGTQIETIVCSVSGNTFQVGDKRYNLALPFGANLQSIKIDSPTQEGTAIITAGKFTMSDKKVTPVKNLLGVLDALRKGPATHEFALGDQKVTFTKIS